MFISAAPSAPMVTVDIEAEVGQRVGLAVQLHAQAVPRSPDIPRGCRRSARRGSGAASGSAVASGAAVASGSGGHFGLGRFAVRLRRRGDFSARFQLQFRQQRGQIRRFGPRVRASARHHGHFHRRAVPAHALLRPFQVLLAHALGHMHGQLRRDVHHQPIDDAVKSQPSKQTSASSGS